MNLFALLLATTVHSHGLTAQLPPGWQVARHSLTPQMLDPRERLSVGTFPLRYREVGCSQMPSSALLDRFTDHWFTFRDHGRNFHVLVAFGPRASAETRAQAWGILDGLKVQPRR